MKRTGKWLCGIVCMLMLSLCISPAALAAENPAYYDCALFLYGANGVPEIITQSSAIQIQAGDGSGDIWAVADYRVTSGATQYIAVNPMDSDSNSLAELIAGDADSGIAVFRLNNQVEGRTAPALLTLDGLTSGDTVAVAGIYEKADSKYFFSRGACIQGLQTRNGYSCLTLTDGSSPLNELDIFPIAAVMTSQDAVIGFYTGNYSALPSGYIMSDAEGIGRLEGSGSEAPSAPPDSGTGDTPSTGSHRIETVESTAGVDTLLKQAESERSQVKILKIALIAAAVALAAGLVAFALIRSKRAQTAALVYPGEEAPHEPTEPLSRTEYVGVQEYGKTEPALPLFRIVPLAGTPGEEREIPLQGLTFGRSLDCDVSFAPDTGGVSGRHCSLLWRGSVLYLKDLDSSYGTLLEDGRKLSGEEAAIQNGIRFYLGSHKIGFQIVEAD